MNRRKFIPGMIFLFGIALAFFGGFLAARNSQDDGQSGRNDLKQSIQLRSEKATSPDESRQILSGDAWKDAKGLLMKRWESSPGVLVDFDLREETRRLLEKVSNEDLEVWLRELRSDEMEDSDWDIQLQMHEMVLMVLAPRAGGSLIRSLAEHREEGKEEDLEGAMEYWITHDPSAVLTWLDGEVPEPIKESLDSYREDALEELAAKNPIEFEARLAQVDQETRESLLRDFAYRRANADQRAEILERATRSPHGDAMALWEGLIKAEVEVNPQLALATLSELKVSDSDRADLDDGLLWWSLRRDPYLSLCLADEDRSGIMQGWYERNFDREVPFGVLETFEEWCQGQTGYAKQWVTNLPSGPHFDTFARSLIRKSAGKHELDYPAAAGMAAKIGDPDLRREVQEKLKKSWQAEDAAATTAWEQSLPATDRERLKQEP